MTGFVLEVAKIELPDGEGKLTLYIQDDDPNFEPPTEVVDSWPIWTNVSHCKELKVKTLSPQKKVLFCPDCGLRLIVPPETETFGQLRVFLNGWKAGPLDPHRD